MRAPAIGWGAGIVDPQGSFVDTSSWMNLIRIISMLAVALPGLLSVGGDDVAGGGGDHGCADATCHEVVVRTTCCGEAIEEIVCPMSGGDCRCVAAPLDEDGPRPQAPAPSPEREIRATVPAARVVIGLLPEVQPSAPVVRAEGWSIFAGRTHNEALALLSVRLT